MSTEHWRWNVNAAWENFCAMCEEAHHGREARHEFDRYKHLRSCLIFGSMALEAFINEQMRQYLENVGTPEEQIYKCLRRPRLQSKINEWPAKFGNGVLQLDPGHSELFALFDDFYDLRNSLVHPKERDHSIHRRLDDLDPAGVVEAVRTTIVLIAVAIPKPFPYWALGWNFVGFNFDNTHPVLLDVAQFRHSFARLGLITPNTAWLYDEANRWTEENMKSANDFRCLKAQLDALPIDIEPWFELIPGMGSPPRLTKRWWDHELIASTIPRDCR
jgi:hypothetical protein